MRKTYNNLAALLLLSIFSIVIIFGCSSDSEKSSSEADASSVNNSEEATSNTVNKKELLTFEDSIEQMLNKPWERILHEDYSGFYENEFSYLTDDVTLDEYLTYRQVTYRYPQDVINIELLAFDELDGDSAFVDVSVTLVDSLGNQEVMPQVLTLYYSDGRWIKPSVSVIKYQLEYEDKIRQAVEDSEDE